MEKFNIVSNDHGRTQKYDFSVINQKYPFVSLTGNLDLVKFKYAEFNVDVYFFHFLPEITFLAKFSPTASLRWTKSNVQNPVLIFTFSVFDQKYSFWANLFQKVKNVSLNWNLVTRAIGICRTQWWCSRFFILDWKYPFRANLV